MLRSVSSAGHAPARLRATSPAARRADLRTHGPAPSHCATLRADDRPPRPNAQPSRPEPPIRRQNRIETVACSEPRVEIELDDIDRIRQTGNAIGAHQAACGPDVLAESASGAKEVPLEVGAAEPEIRVDERINRRVGFEVFVADVSVPIPEMSDLP